MGSVGVEPTRLFSQLILSQSRLPTAPRSLVCITIILQITIVSQAVIYRYHVVAIRYSALSCDLD